MRSGAHTTGLGCSSNPKGTSLAAAGLILLWVFLFLSQLRVCHSTPDQKQHFKAGHDRLFVKVSVPRKLIKVVQQKVSRSHNPAAAAVLPPEQSDQFVNLVKGDGSEIAYEDDKRRVHTGPNPLHN